MILHLMAPFRTHFNIRDEERNINSQGYKQFWDEAFNTMAETALNANFKKVTFLHKSNSEQNIKSRFRDVNANALRQPLNIINFLFKDDDQLIASTFDEVKSKNIGNNNFDQIMLIADSVIVRVFNNSVAILEAEINIKGLFEKSKKEEVGEILDSVQEFGVSFGEVLCEKLYRERIEAYLKKLVHLPKSNQFIKKELFKFENALANGILVPDSTSEKNEIQVNWVTRTLLIESPDEKFLKEAIGYWLKDSGDAELVKKVIADDSACSIKWLNYLFREKSYYRIYRKDGSIDYEQPFNDKWQAMLFSQYYYTAFEALNDSLQATLTISYKNMQNRENKSFTANPLSKLADWYKKIIIGEHRRMNLRKLNRKLERDIIDANLITLEYQNNFGYYKRDVSNHMKEIMKSWEFEDAILNQVEQKAKYCTERMEKLHQKETSKSSLYSDMLLLGIAVISIIAFMFQVIEYGRNISLNADLAVYETNSWKLVNLVSERPTDFVILLSIGLIIILFVVYYFFRRTRVLD